MEAEQNNSVLSKCQSETFARLIHCSIDKLLGRKGPIYQDYSAVWNLEEWWQAIDVIQEICTECGKNNLNREQMQKSFDGLPEKHQEILLGALAIRKKELREALLSQTTSISGNYLQDFDWKLKLVLSSDKLATVREMFVSVDFDIRTTKGSNSVSVEMNKEELKKMILSLEAANKAVTQLKS